MAAGGDGLMAWRFFLKKESNGRDSRGHLLLDSSSGF